MSFVEPVEFHCPSCGKSRDNPNATLRDERDNFRSIVNCSEPRVCSDCRPLRRDHPFPDPVPSHTELLNQRSRTILGVPAPLHLPSPVLPLEPDDTTVVDVLDGIPAHLRDDPVREAHRSYVARFEQPVVVNVEVNAAGQIVITGAERGP